MEEDEKKRKKLKKCFNRKILNLRRKTEDNKNRIYVKFYCFSFISFALQYKYQQQSHYKIRE